MEETHRAMRIWQSQPRENYVDIWIPKSQIELERFLGKDPDGNTEIDLEVPIWLAEKEGLDYR